MADTDNLTPAPATAAILTLGCKLNIADSETLARRLRQAGWQVTDRAAGADAVIVNSCSVTHVADQKSRHLVRQARRLAPGATVALTGCLVETAKPGTLDALEADLITRKDDQLAIAEHLIALHPATRPSSEVELRPALKTRAFIAAQEGCNDVCAFCIIPRTRGRERSKPVADVVAEVQARETEGVQEVVITGTQLGAYGRDRGDANPYDLLKALLNQTSVPRIRMSSLQPQDITPALVGLWRDERLCRHFHLALQSGSEAVLERMRRRYTAARYRDGVARLRDAIPDVAITTDVIAGFPGETDAEFEESHAFCEEMAFAGVHVFPYSQRSNTLAARMPGQVADATKKRRVQRLIALSETMASRYRERFIGRTIPVLWETRRDRDTWEGLTGTYIRVHAVSADDLHHRLTPVRLLAANGAGLSGEVDK